MLVLDDDKAGRRASEIYGNEYFLNKDLLITVATIDSKFKNMRLEGFIDDVTKSIIQSHFNSDKKVSKKQIGLYLS